MFKKIISSLITLSLLSGFLVINVQAQPTEGVFKDLDPNLLSETDKPSVAEISNITSSDDLFYKVFNFALSFVGIVAMAMLVIAGYYYITAGGEEGQIDKAKKMILATVIGVIIIISSYTIVATVLNIGPASQGGWQDFASQFTGGLF